MFRSTSQIVVFLVLFLCGAMSDIGFSRSTSGVRCNERDRELLSQFRKSLVDPSDVLSSWSSEEDCCKWSGVECHNITGRVTMLSLINSLDEFEKPLGGEINLRLLQLDYLVYLDLSNNDFTAVHCSADHGQRYQNLSQLTPSHLSANFSILFYLDLSQNLNMKMDNLEWLSCIPSVKYLNLSSTDIHREPAWLHSFSTFLPSLSELGLTDCQLSPVSSSPRYDNFSSLTLLDLSSTFFDSKIPNWISNLSDSLSYLYLGGNKLDGKIPDTLLNVRNLKTLVLADNNLSGSIPEWLGQYKHLETLDLSYNSFHGSVPSTVGNLTSLTELDVSYNLLNSSLPESLWQLSSLETLMLGGNSFAGLLSESNFAKLSNLKSLDLSSSPLLFHFGTNWIPPFQLVNLIMNSCMLGPKFPAWIYTQNSLRQLQISSSGISSIDEDKFWSFVSNLTVALDISNNSISGNISNQVLHASLIDLTSNNITGGLPCLTHTLYFLAGNNSFSGLISDFLCGNGNADGNELAYLDLSYNHLSGELSECWINWKNLESITLGDNDFTGKIPHSFGSLSYLHSLRLFGNNLSGDVPVSLQHCEKLRFLNLGENQLSGGIPIWMGESMSVIRLRSNQFSGNIPPQICQFSSLIVLDLADNRLSGPIPNCLYNITSMKSPNITYLPGDYVFDVYYLSSISLVTKGQDREYGHCSPKIIDLSNNNLFGRIPRELFALSALQSLNLSQNHFFGNIPPEIGKMKYLESLDLSRNQLDGKIPQTISGLSFLSYLNLSFNNFTGKIPTGTQLQGFDALSYIGNRELCGAPLKNCTKEKQFVDTKLNAEGEDEFMSRFYLGIGIGFATGFWGVCAAIFFNRAFRHAYFRLLDDVKVHVLLMMNSFY